MRRVRRLLRLPLLGFALYLAAVLLFTLATLAAVLGTRVAGHDPRADMAGIDNFRRVDHQVWAGSQPTLDQYRALRRAGVRLVIDLRTGADDDPHEADRAALRRLGLRYARHPIKDGHAPADAGLRRLVRLLNESTGVVYVHCGAGVGRTATAVAGYQASRGMDPSLWEAFAVGRLSLHQAWFVARSAPREPAKLNPIVRRVSEVLDAPRRALSRLGAVL